MQLSKRSLATYIILLIIGVPLGILGLVSISNLGLLLVALLIASGVPMAAVATYGLAKRKNISALPVATKAALIVGIVSLVCFISLMTLIIIALKDFS